jgi:hypothetical protein
MPAVPSTSSSARDSVRGMFEAPYYDPQLTPADIRGIEAVTHSGWGPIVAVRVRIKTTSAP